MCGDPGSGPSAVGRQPATPSGDRPPPDRARVLAPGVAGQAPQHGGDEVAAPAGPGTADGEIPRVRIDRRHGRDNGPRGSRGTESGDRRRAPRLTARAGPSPAGAPIPTGPGGGASGDRHAKARTTPRLAIQNDGLRRRTERGWRTVTAARRERIWSRRVGRNPEAPPRLEDLHHLLGQRLEDRGRGRRPGAAGAATHRWRVGQEPAGEGVSRRDEVEDHLRVAGEPGRDGGVQVGHQVVRKDVDPPPPGDPGRHVGQEPEPVGDPILGSGPGDHPDGRRQADGIAGRHGGRPGGRRAHRGRGGPVRADRVPADDQGAVQGGAVPPEHFGEAGEPRERAPQAHRGPPVGGEAGRLAEAVDGGGAHPGFAGQGPATPGAPVGAHTRREQGPEGVEDLGEDHRGPPGAGRVVLEAGEPLGGKPGPPAADAFPVGPEGASDGGIGTPGDGLEDDAGPADEPARDPAPPGPAFQGGAFVGGQDDRDRPGGGCHGPGAYTRPNHMSPYF